MKLSLVSALLFAVSGLVAGFSDKQGKSSTHAKPGSHIGHVKHAPHKRIVMAKARLEHQISQESADKPVHSEPASLEKRSFRGQGTYFYPGQGACGWTASSKDHIAALNHDQYGDMGGRSSLCGRWIWIKNVQTGQSTRAQIQDACPGCQYGSLDLSPAAFDDLAPESQGVVQIEWDFA